MNEKLIIRNFGPIKNVELDLGRFNVIIGEQATGKTMIGKILCCCRYFSYIALDDLPFIAGQTKFSIGLTQWGLKESIRDDSFIFYKCADYSLTVSQKPFVDSRNNHGKVFNFTADLVPISKDFNNLLLERDKLLSNLGDTNNDDPLNRVMPTSFFLNDVAAVMNNPLFIPTERGLQSIFSLGKNSISNIDDSLFNQFAKADQIQRHFKTETIIEPLGIEYKNESGYGSYRRIGNADWYRMGNAPSGYKTAIPIVLALKYYGEDKKGKSLVIDEPEISLFPSTQNSLVKFIANEFNTHNGFLLMTTHSPYILTSLSNLIYAYQTGQSHKERVNEIIEEKYWLDPNKVSAYQLLSDGTCENIIAEDGLIMAEKIDVISRTINEEYDKILDIQYAK